MPKDNKMGYGNPHKPLPAPEKDGYMKPNVKPIDGIPRPTFPSFDTSKQNPNPGMAGGGRPKTHGY